MGMVAAGDLFIGRDFFVLQAFAKDKSCRDLGLASVCGECGPQRICEPKKLSDGKTTCYQCRDKQRCEDKGQLSKSACDSCAKDPKTMCAPTGSKDDFSK